MKKPVFLVLVALSPLFLGSILATPYSVTPRELTFGVLNNVTVLLRNYTTPFTVELSGQVQLVSANIYCSSKPMKFEIERGNLLRVGDSSSCDYLEVKLAIIPLSKGNVTLSVANARGRNSLSLPVVVPRLNIDFISKSGTLDIELKASGLVNVSGVRICPQGLTFNGMGEQSHFAQDGCLVIVYPRGRLLENGSLELSLQEPTLNGSASGFLGVTVIYNTLLTCNATYRITLTPEPELRLSGSGVKRALAVKIALLPSSAVGFSGRVVVAFNPPIRISGLTCKPAGVVCGEENGYITVVARGLRLPTELDLSGSVILPNIDSNRVEVVVRIGDFSTSFSWTIPGLWRIKGEVRENPLTPYHYDISVGNPLNGTLNLRLGDRSLSCTLVNGSCSVFLLRESLWPLLGEIALIPQNLTLVNGTVYYIELSGKTSVITGGFTLSLLALTPVAAYVLARGARSWRMGVTSREAEDEYLLG